MLQNLNHFYLSQFQKDLLGLADANTSHVILSKMPRGSQQVSTAQYVRQLWFSLSFVLLLLFFPFKAFGIIKFHEPAKDGRIDMCPVSWTKQNGGKCTTYWPNDGDAPEAKTLLKLVSKQAVVNRDSWEIFNITVIAKSGNIKIQFPYTNFTDRLLCYLLHPIFVYF